MKKWVALLAAVAIGVSVWLYCASNKTSSPVPPRTVEQQNAAVANVLASQSTNTIAIIESNFARVQPAEVVLGSAAQMSTPPAGPAVEPEISNIPPEIAVENMSRMIHQYGEMFGGNPVGENADFTRQLSGGNPKHINFISTEAGMRINDQDELIDPWGMPYFFHQLSGSDTEVRSAGPDKIMYTADDIVK